MFDNIWKLGKATILLVSLVTFIGWLPELIPSYIHDHFNKGQGGIVIVDSPEVYSRERMINDRFREVSWLEYELKQSTNREFGNQAISSRQKTLRMNTKIGITNTSNENGDTIIKSDDTPDAKPKESNPGVSVSPGERFRDIRAYREEIRTEMMETLLDDRHDIKGNTLYRLKFDTTVLPQENTEKLAVIQVKLERAKFCDSGATALKGSLHLPCISVRAIHDAWLSQTEQKINAAIDGSIKDFIDMKLSPRNFAEFVRFLQARVSDKTDNEENLPAQNINIWNNFKKYSDSCVQRSKRKYTGGKTKKEKDDNYKSLVSSIKSCQPVPVSVFFELNHDSQVRERYTKLRKLLLRYYSEQLVNDNGSLKIYSDFKATHTKFNDPEFSVLISDLKNQSNKWMSPLSETQSDAFDFPKLFKNSAPDSGGNSAPDSEKEDDPVLIIRKAEEIMRDAKKIVAEAESIELALLRYAIVGMWIDQYTYPDKVWQNECKKLYEDKLEVFDPKSLSCLAHIEKTTCNDVNHCTIRVGAGIEPKQDIDKTTVEKGAAHLRNQIRRNFKRLLQIEEIFYSYAVTPKERAQRVLTIASESRQKQLALSLIASSGGELDQATISSITRAISDSASQIKQIQRRPLILSFGRGQPVFWDSKKNDSDAPGKNQPNQRGTDFGWVIGPKYMFSDGNDNKIRFYHAPVQNSLSAIISVPSWWTVVNLKIDTCWIAQDQLTKLKETKFIGEKQVKKRNYVIDFCNPAKVKDIHNVDADYLVRLPGSAEELPRKFGYEIERVPAVFDGGAVADFYVGQKEASLIIQGNELWRSTVVTMGNQKANNIEVLPNMKGIIATFDTIDSPSETIAHESGGPTRAHGNCFVMSEVLVWTSEGRTHKGQIFARIHANPLLNREINRLPKPDPSVKPNIQYPKGFGDCRGSPKESKKPKEPVVSHNAGKLIPGVLAETSDPKQL